MPASTLDEMGDLVSALHASPLRYVLIVAGAGVSAVASLTAAAGASRTLLEATVPYSRAALRNLLGSVPESIATGECARALAQVAYERALSLRDAGHPVAGLACTSAIATDRPRRGDHRAHVAVRTASERIQFGVSMEKGLRDRAGEEMLTGRLVLRAMALSARLDCRLGLGLSPAESLRIERLPGEGDDPISLLLSGAVGWVHAGGDGVMACERGVRGALLSGSFNPLHRGHVQLREAARAALGCPVTFELSIANVDKPSLTRDQVAERLAALPPGSPVVVSDASKFSQKARLFAGTTFVVGYDTAARAVDPAYHGGPDGLAGALGQVRAAGCRFLVAGRQMDGQFRSLIDLDVPCGFRELFEELPESAFRSDVSSTDIRAWDGRQMP